MKSIYLDNAATTKPISTILEVIKPYIQEQWHNPSSLYDEGVKVKQKIESIRKELSDLINAKSSEIIFTSGASESNNMAIRGWVDEQLTHEYGMVNIITTPIEHKSILEAVKNPNLGACVRYCDVDENGLVDCKILKKLLEFREGEPILVTLASANNEIGSLQNIGEIADLVHKYGGTLHIDATQSLPYIPVDVDKMGIDMLSASAHKFGGLKGCGFLYKKNNVNIKPLIYGSQEGSYRGGTENVIGIVAMGEALKFINYDRYDDLCRKRDYLIKLLEFKFGCKLNGHPTYRLPNNANVTFPQNITGEGLLYTLDISDIKISTGSACNSKEITPSHVLKAIGLTDDEAMRSVRFTLSDEITYEDIDEVINEIDKTIKLIEMLGDD